MKTTFLLHGGQLKNKDARNNSYFRRLVKGLQDGDEVLFIGFARPDITDRQRVFKRDRDYILEQTNKLLTVVDATYDQFLSQVERASAVHVTGGEIAGLVDAIRKYPKFVESLRGKTVGGSSAGACLFSTYYFSCKPDMSVGKGLGTFPIRLLVHNGSTAYHATDQAVSELEKYPADLELLKLKECEWVKKEIDL